MEGSEGEGNATGQGTGTFDLLKTEHRSGDHYARLPGSSNWNRYKIELDATCLKYSRTYRPSLFASKETESGEVKLSDMKSPRWKNVASRQERSHCFYIDVQQDRKFYMQARDNKDLLEWIRCLETNLLQTYCCLQLSRSAPHQTTRAFPCCRLNQSVLHSLDSMSLVRLSDNAGVDGAAGPTDEEFDGLSCLPPSACTYSSAAVAGAEAEAELRLEFRDSDWAILSPTTASKRKAAAEALASRWVPHQIAVQLYSSCAAVLQLCGLLDV